MPDSGHRRVVVKIGSGVLTRASEDGALEVDRNALYRLAADVSAAKDSGVEVLLVSSGATALGMEERNLRSRPEGLDELQALAAVGQGLLMALWRDAFARAGVSVAQVLLTHSDLADRQRLQNVRKTLTRLLDWGIVPVINENDSVMTDEITVGDNDRLAAQVAKLTDASLLMLLSSVAGVLDSQGNVVPEITSESEIAGLVHSGRSSTGRGGMTSKLESGFAAVAGGIDVVIASGRQSHVVTAAASGVRVGTRLPAAQAQPMTARQHWIAYTLRSRGRLHVDQGAIDAVLGGGASVLPVGLTAVDGVFDVGDAVDLVAPDGRVVARGLAMRDAQSLRQQIGRRGPPAVHRDNLVLRPHERNGGSAT